MSLPIGQCLGVPIERVSVATAPPVLAACRSIYVAGASHEVRTEVPISIAPRRAAGTDPSGRWP